MKHLLIIDAIINLFLGILILCLPLGLIDLLGLPTVQSYFYSSILGGVIFGIGVALVLELIHGGTERHGLGLMGAIAINLCGGATLLFWLIFIQLEIGFAARVILWLIAVAVLMIGFVEIRSLGPLQASPDRSRK
jgi:hypothetical protein